MQVDEARHEPSTTAILPVVDRPSKRCRDERVVAIRHVRPRATRRSTSPGRHPTPRDGARCRSAPRPRSSRVVLEQRVDEFCGWRLRRRRAAPGRRLPAGSARAPAARSVPAAGRRRRTPPLHARQSAQRRAAHRSSGAPSAIMARAAPGAWLLSGASSRLALRSRPGARARAARRSEAQRGPHHWLAVVMTSSIVVDAGGPRASSPRGRRRPRAASARWRPVAGPKPPASFQPGLPATCGSSVAPEK